MLQSDLLRNVLALSFLSSLLDTLFFPISLAADWLVETPLPFNFPTNPHLKRFVHSFRLGCMLRPLCQECPTPQVPFHQHSGPIIEHYPPAATAAQVNR